MTMKHNDEPCFDDELMELMGMPWEQFVPFVFHTELPFKEVRSLFDIFRKQWETPGSYELDMYHDNEDAESSTGNLENGPITQVVVGHKCDIDSRVVHALCKWVSGIMIDEEVRVLQAFVSSSSNAAKEEPLFWVITKAEVHQVRVSEVFASWNATERRENLEWVVMDMVARASALMGADEASMAAVYDAWKLCFDRPDPDLADLAAFTETASVAIMRFKQHQAERGEAGARHQPGRAAS
jgi:hypothetical protein